MNSALEQLSNMLAIDSAISEIKENKSKYPEFDFWVPGYDAEGWAEKAIKDYNKIMEGNFDNTPIVFKLIVMRHYRKLSQKWRKAGKGDSINSTEFAEELARVVKELHPEFFKGNVIN
jgi:hypothetical protein